MSLILTGAPALEPVSLAEAKVHCRVDTTAEDAFITSLIVTSRLQLEALLGLALIQQSWLWRFDAWPAHAVVLPLRPVLGVTSVRIQNDDLTFTTVPSTDYIIDGQSQPARLVTSVNGFPKPGAAALGIEIQLTAGFGATPAAVPAPLRQAILLLVAHWFETREPAAPGAEANRIPAAIAALIEPYRTRRL